VVYPTTSVDIPIHRFRVLFSDGAVEDFLANRDDSVLREHMLRTHWGARGKPEHGDRKDPRAIVGVTDLGLVYVHTPVDGPVGNGSADASEPTATDTPPPKVVRRRRPTTP